jgi:hypothetical protein
MPVPRQHSNHLPLASTEHKTQQRIQDPTQDPTQNPAQDPTQDPTQNPRPRAPCLDVGEGTVVHDWQAAWVELADDCHSSTLQRGMSVTHLKAAWALDSPNASAPSLVSISLAWLCCNQTCQWFRHGSALDSAPPMARAPTSRPIRAFLGGRSAGGPCRTSWQRVYFSYSANPLGLKRCPTGFDYVCRRPFPHLLAKGQFFLFRRSNRTERCPTGFDDVCQHTE